jgi:hypothetical protein
MLYTEEMIHEDFEELTCDMSEIQRVVLNEELNFAEPPISFDLLEPKK